MNRYVLLEAPKEEGDYSSQIVMIDNSKVIGKEKVDKLTREGWTPAGVIESELTWQRLAAGFCHDETKRIEAGQKVLNEIFDMSNRCI